MIKGYGFYTFGLSGPGKNKNWTYDTRQKRKAMKKDWKKFTEGRYI